MAKYKVKFTRLIEQTGELIIEAESREKLAALAHSQGSSASENLAGANNFAWNDIVAYAYLNPKKKIKWRHKHLYIDEVRTYIDEETEEKADINITELPEILIDNDDE